MRFRPHAHPLNWYPYEVTGSVGLLSAYVEDIEEQVRKGIDDYQLRAATVLVEPQFDEEPTRVVTVHKALDNETWDLTEIFENYFPGLQRRSALVTLFSFFEHELEALCKRIKSHGHHKIALADMANKGIMRSTVYLEKVGGLTALRSNPEWQEINNIQSIRNLIVHADGKIPGQTGGNSEKVAAYIQRSPHLQGDREIAILKGYLAHTLHTFEAYFSKLHVSIECKYGAASLKSLDTDRQQQEAVSRQIL